MCGILVEISRRTAENQPCSRLAELNSLRGPDSQQTITLNRGDFVVRLTATVLSLRGTDVTVQPLIEKAGNGDVQHALCWNGEAWRINGTPVTVGSNDALLVWELLLGAVAKDSVDAVAEALGAIEGPYAFVFYEARKDKLWFGRDLLGRRSLVQRRSDQGVVLSSLGVRNDTKSEWAEVEADGIYCLDLSSQKLDTRHIPYGQNQTDHSIPSASQRLTLPMSINSAIPSLPFAPVTEFSPSVVHLKEHLLQSVKTRVEGIPTVTHVSNTSESPFQHNSAEARVAILFSGGLDCTLLARLVHEVLPADEPIDLLNVAFENKRVVKAANTEKKKGKGKSKNGSTEEDGEPVPLKSDPYSLCPDRRTGVQSYDELKTVCAGRTFRLIKINVSAAESQEHRSTILDLLYPHNTQMDLSIGMAFYFASRGCGVLHPSREPFATSARVLLSGLGADELFGGYQRHATAYRRGSFPSLVQELQLDVGRLGKRNMGRDDRVLSHWGRETRFPFLDEQFVSWALQLPVSVKCGFGIEGMSDDDAGKLALRCVARRLGMPNVSGEKKRAIQFGARSAKMDILPPGSGRVRGTDRLD